MKRISFILPCYNVEKYIGACLDSLYDQDLPMDAFEVICVNDCSTDRTREIIVSRQADCPNLVLLDLPRNGYPGLARNKGMEVATGEYVWFVDSDDLLKPGVVKEVFREMDAEPLDFLLFNFDEFRGDDPSSYIDRKDLYGSWPADTGLAFLASHFKNNLRRVSLVWLCVFRRRFLQEHGISFPELCMSEDSVFLWQAFFEADSVKAVRDRFYVHRLHSSSIIQSGFDARRSISCAFLLPDAIGKVIGKYESRIPAPLTENLSHYQRHEVNLFGSRYLQLPAAERKKYYHYLRTHRNWYRQFQDMLSRKNRLAYQVGFLGERVFARVVRQLTKD